MLIDDNVIDNFIHQKMLESCVEKEIITFPNAIAALEHLKQNAKLPEFILLDIGMPIMDGFEFLEKFYDLENAESSTKIIILSTSLDPSDVQNAKQKNCLGFLQKPLKKEDIEEYLLTDRLN